MSEKSAIKTKHTLRIEMMSRFGAYVDERQLRELVERSRKGAAVLQYLVLHRGETVGRQKLIEVFWEEDDSANPESALKTLISRLRKLLADCAGEEIADCIASGRGGYRFEPTEGVSVDLYELEDALDALERKPHEDERERLTQKALSLYTGDLLEQSAAGQFSWIIARSTALHNRMLEAIHQYIAQLERRKNYRGIVEVCRRALDIDALDDGIHISLMDGLVKTGRTNEALLQYKHVMHLYSRYLGMPLSDELRELYDHIARAHRTVEFSLEAIAEQLTEGDDARGAFVCEYSVFKEVFNLQMRCFQRTGVEVFLAIIMVEGSVDRVVDSIEQDKLMNGLRDILQENLRRGDTVTRFSPTIFALLLPTVNYKTGNMVMERVKRLFYRKFPNSDIEYKYLIGPLTGEDRVGTHAPEAGRAE